jgi:hypothetical protein
LIAAPLEVPFLNLLGDRTAREGRGRDVEKPE